MKKPIVMLLTISFLSSTMAPLAFAGGGDTVGTGTKTEAGAAGNTTENHSEDVQKDGKEQDATDRSKTVDSVKDQRWMNRLVSLVSILNISFDPWQIQRAIQDASSDSLVSRLTSDHELIKEYGPENVKIYVQELDTMLKNYSYRIKTPDSEGHDSGPSDWAKDLSYEATVAAAALYSEAKFEGLTPEKFQEKLMAAMRGYYYLTRSTFRELPNKVAIRKEDRVEVIPGAKYTTNIVTLTNDEIFNEEYHSQVNKEKIEPVLKLMDIWGTELQKLKIENDQKKNASMSKSAEEFPRYIKDYLNLGLLADTLDYDGSIIIATSTYNDKVQAITVGTLYGQGQYHIEYTLTAPHNILANEGTHPGAANYLVSSTIRYFFDTYKQATLVTSKITSPYNVKSRLRLGFARRYGDAEAEGSSIGSQVKEAPEPNREVKVEKESKQQGGVVSESDIADLENRLLALRPRVLKAINEEEVELEKKLAKLHEKFGPSGSSTSAKVAETKTDEFKEEFNKSLEDKVITDAELEGLNVGLAKLKELFGPSTPTEVEKIDKLQARLDKLRKDGVVESSELDKLQDVLTRVRKVAKGAEGVGYLQVRLERLRGVTPTSEEVTELLNKLDELPGISKGVSSTSEVIEALEEAIELEERLAQLEKPAEFDELQERMNRLRNVMIITDTEVDDLKAGLAKVSEKVSPEASTEIDDLQERLEKLRGKTIQRTLVKEKPVKNSAKKIATTEELEQRMKSLRQSVAKASSIVNELEPKFTQLREKHSQVIPSVEELKQRWLKLKGLSSVLTSGMQDVEPLLSQLRGTKSTTPEVVPTIEQLEQRLANLKKATTQAIPTVEELEQRLSQLKGETTQAIPTVEEIEQRLAELKKPLSETVPTVEELEDRLTQLKLQDAPNVPGQKGKIGTKTKIEVAEQDPAYGKGGVPKGTQVKKAPQISEEELQARLDKLRAKTESSAGKVGSDVENGTTETKGSTSTKVSSEVPDVPKTSANVPKAPGNVTEAESAELTKTLAKLREQAFPELRAAANLERWAAPEVEGILSRVKGLAGRIGVNIEEMLVSDIPVIGTFIDLAILVYQVYSDIEGEKEWTAQQAELSKKLTSLEQVLTQIEKETQPTWWEKNRWYFYWIPAVAIVDGASYGIGKAMAAHPSSEQKAINDKWRELVQDIQKYVKVLHDIRDLSVDLKERIETGLSQEIKTELSQIKEKESELKQLESKIVAEKNEINRRQRAENEAREKYNLELQPVGGAT